MNPGHVSGQDLHPISVRSGPPKVDRFGEEFEPAAEVGLGEWALPMHRSVLSERVSGVTPGAEEKPAPELGDLWQMIRPIDLGNIVEQWPKQFVLGDVAIKPPNECCYRLG